MKSRSRLAALVLAGCATVVSGCAHLRSDPGLGQSSAAAAARDRLDRQEFDRMDRQNRDHERTTREMTQRSYDNSK